MGLGHLWCHPVGLFDLMNRIKKRGRPRIRTAQYWREYYTRKQREWRAAHPRIRTGRKPTRRRASHQRTNKPATVRKWPFARACCAAAWQTQSLDENESRLTSLPARQLYRFPTSSAYGEIRSVSVSVWKSVWSRIRDQGLSFLVVWATLFFSPVAKSSHEL